MIEEALSPSAPAKLRKPRRRTQEERRAETRNALIEATIGLLAEGGYANATTTRIARRAGVSLGAMQHHFGSKDELLMETFDQLMLELTTQMSLDPGRGQALESRVETLVTRLWDVYCSPRYVAVWELFLGTRAEPHLREEAVAQRSRSLRIFADLWWSFFKDDVASEQVVVDVMHTTLAMLRGFAFYSVFEKDEAFFARQRTLIKTFVFDALRSGAQAKPPKH